MAQETSTLLSPEDDSAVLLAHSGMDAAHDAVFKDTTNTTTTTTPQEGGGGGGGGSLKSPTATSSERGEYFVPLMDVLPSLASRLEMGEEFVCGWGAAFINITATFPLNKVMFRQQLQGIRGHRAVAQLRREGLGNLYRGLLPPLLLKTSTMSLMFGSYTKLQRALDSAYTQAPPPLTHALAAMMAGTLEAALTPFERIQTLLQDRTYHRRFRHTLHAAVELRAYGVREYYRGLALILLRNGPSNVFFFLGREFVNSKFPALTSESSHIAKDFVCGACLGAFISTVFFPLNVVKTRMQSQLGGPFVGIRESFQQMWHERNRRLSNLFRGVHVNYTRSFISWGIINASYEYLLHVYRQFKSGSL